VIAAAPKIRIVALLVVALLLLILSAAAGANEVPPERIEDVPAPQSDAPLGYFPKPQYIGTPYCYACHLDIANEFVKTKMGRRFLLHPQTDIEKRGCEGCHGPGSNHATTGGGRSMGNLIEFRIDRGQSIDDANRVCLDCHNEMFWHGRTHGAATLACFDCHLIMSKESPTSQLMPPRVSRWKHPSHWGLAAIAGIVAGLITGIIFRRRG
jgi:hypothetical protein